MIVLLTGMFRSGSTWAFNVAKAVLSLEARAIVGVYENDIGSALARLDEDIQHLLIKTHMPNRVGHLMIKHRMARTICTYRDPLDCIVSSMEVFGSRFEETVALARGALAVLDVQAKCGGILFVAHAAITDRPDAAVGAVADYLGCAVGAADIGGIATLFSKQNVARFVDNLTHGAAAKGEALPRDPDTLLHPGHIRRRPGTPDSVLTAEQRRYAIEQLMPFVDADGRLSSELRGRLRDAGAVG
jgi:hypothetical protein